MLKTLTREIALSIQARTGTSGVVAVWLVIVAVALITAFIFLCVAAYDWLTLHYGSVTAGLIMAAIFLAIAVLAAIVSALIRRRVRERAILARAARAHAPSWLLDPRLLNAAVQAGRTVGWQRIVPVALLAFMAAQWAREHKEQGRQQN